MHNTPRLVNILSHSAAVSWWRGLLTTSCPAVPDEHGAACSTQCTGEATQGHLPAWNGCDGGVKGKCNGEGKVARNYLKYSETLFFFKAVLSHVMY